MKKIVIIMNDKNRQRYLRSVLKEYALFPAYTGKSGLYRVQNISPDLVITDIHLPDISGFEVVRELNRYYPALPVVINTPFSDTRNAVTAIKTGAVDFLPADYPQNQLKNRIRSYLLQDTQTEDTYGSKLYPELNTLIGRNDKIQGIKEAIISMAETEIPVLITGETGTGKELVAQLIHSTSNKKKGPFKIMNSAGIPATLFEAELFGTVTGAFTDATNRIGLFEQAHQGTLFIDEIGDMPVGHQVKVLRVLEDKEIIRLGSSISNYVTVRLISATNQDLAELIKNRLFRQDLLYRIYGMSIKLPPLRERKEDIPLLVEHFMENRQKEPSNQALKKLMGHHWPGNVRELKQVIELSIIKAKKAPTIYPEHITFCDF